MSMQIIILLMQNAPAKSGSSALFSALVPLLVIFGIFYLFLIVPQMRNEKKRKALLASIKKGDKVMTVGGIVGTVSKVDEHFISLKVSQDTTIKFERSAVKLVFGSEDGSQKSKNNR